MKNLRRSMVMFAMLAAISSVQGAYAQSTQPQTSSAESSRSLDTRAIDACSSAADELKASRRLIELVETENALLRTRLETESRMSSMLRELSETRKTENEALRIALAAKNETITAKDAAIASQETHIEALKKKRTSPWKRIGDLLIGVAAGMVLR